MMKEEDLKSVIMTIAGRPFPVKVDYDESFYVKDLEQEINAKIMDYQKTYPTRDKLDCVIMTLLSYTFDLRKGPTSVEQEEVTQKLQTIIEVLNDTDFN
ncbi:MAG: cell division protein ZapA [Saprospiraceae bacterium]|jgi:cell division protein ZapA|nr:cell division protein ZapA [Saprospiraceae bacterium]MBL0026685.1 cell division protein ZapA [Saprospiraceae bacterium]